MYRSYSSQCKRHFSHRCHNRISNIVETQKSWVNECSSEVLKYMQQLLNTNSEKHFTKLTDTEFTHDILKNIYKACVRVFYISFYY